MSYVPDSSQLRGLPLEVAERYGKPHVGALYLRDDARSHVCDHGAACAVCGRPATNVHHVAPLSKGGVFLLKTGWGQFALKTALFALCGTGTTGCHGGFHGGARLRARWEWDSDEAAEAWWSGELLKSIPAHSPELYELGCWVVEDAGTGLAKAVRMLGHGTGEGAWR